MCVGDINRMISPQARGQHDRVPVRAALEALSKTDLILAPPGHSRDEARALIQKTHVNPDVPPHAKKHTGRVAFARSALARLRSNSFEPP